MDGILDKVKEEVSRRADSRGCSWFVERHVKLVVENVKYILDNEESARGANRDALLLAAWLHDMQRVEMPEKDDEHEELGAEIAAEILSCFGVAQETIDSVSESISRHSARKRAPESVEAKILATADAMSHFSPDFFLSLLLYGTPPKNDVGELKKWALAKLEKDMNGGKMYFESARRKVAPMYEKLRAFFEA